MRIAVLRGKPLAYCRNDLAAEELDRAQDALVRDPADGELEHEPVVAEDLVLEEDLLDDVCPAFPRSSRRGASPPCRSRRDAWVTSPVPVRSGSSRPRRTGTTRRAPAAASPRGNRAS